MPDITKDIQVVNSLGVHARPAAAIVQCVLRFESDVFITFNGNRVNAKSIMGLLTLAATKGSRLKISCSGPDAEAAIRAIDDLFTSKFGEE
ncbi:MAG TPA: HPr family phosphocarrier protein [Candidatus Hydrogenedentes bacterium]|nr:HPr family phosphocarrier protein [Candidatus Hydrogenedentota bacterium]